MTEQEFISTPPSDYGVGNANLLISSSVSGSENIPIPPFTVQGFTIPFNSKTGVGILSALKEVSAIKFQYEGGVKTVNIIARQKKDNYFYLRTDPLVINSIPSPTGNEYVFESAEFIFEPYFEISYFNNDYNPLINNSNESKPNAIRQVVDRISSQAVPTNLTAILSQSAEPAQIQNCSYTKAGIIRGHYEGSVESSRGIPGNDPALGLVRFDGAQYPLDSDTTTIKTIQLSDRTVIDLFFDSKVVGTHPNKVFQTFPAVGSFIFELDSNTKRFSKVPNSKLYSIDKNQIYTTDEFGEVTSIT